MIVVTSFQNERRMRFEVKMVLHRVKIKAGLLNVEKANEEKEGRVIKTIFESLSIDWSDLGTFLVPSPDKNSVLNSCYEVYTKYF